MKFLRYLILLLVLIGGCSKKITKPKHSMEVTIEVKEVDALRKVCALTNTKCNVFTWTAQYSKAILTEEDGSELSAKDAWHLANSFRFELQLEEQKNFHY